MHSIANIESCPAPSKSLLTNLHHLLAKLIGIAPEAIDMDTPLLETGADSIVLLSAIREMESNYGVKVSTQQLFEELITPRLLAAYIEQQLAVSTRDVEQESTPFSCGLTPRIAQEKATTAHSTELAQINQRLNFLTQQIEFLLADKTRLSQNTLAPPLENRHSLEMKNHTASPTLGWQTKKTDSSQRNLTQQQQQHLQGLIQRLTQRTCSSKEYAARYQKLLADSKATVGFRLSIKELLYPIVGERTQGARLWDIDGNEYLDMTMGFGVHLFGYRPDFLKKTLQDYALAGLGMGPRAPLVGKVAELVSELTGMERVAFTSSGTEATMTALRIARAATGKSKYVIFKNSYHGHADFSLIEAQTNNTAGIKTALTPGIPDSMLVEALVLDYGSEEALNIIAQHGAELAAVMVEPIQSRNPELQPREFLQQLRAITTEHNIALIFDEMLTGFRLHPGGAQAWFGVRCDMATYGKIAGGGMPIGIIAGSAHYLDRVDGGEWHYQDDSYPAVERTFVGGTYCQHDLVLATAYAMLQEIKRQGPQLQQTLNEKTAQLAATLNEFFSSHQLPIRIVYWGSLFKFSFSANLDLLFYHLLEKGVYIWEWRNCFLSTAHTDADIAYFITAVKESVEALQQGGFLASSSLLVNANSPESLNYWQRHHQKPALHRPTTITPITTHPQKKHVDFSVYYFGHYDAEYSAEKYQLLFSSVRFADEHGFKAAWLPERHFHPFGGFSPNPAVLCAALAHGTQQIQLRGGSVVLPLHHPVRVAEEWAVVDNLSNGRVGIAFASGWHPHDFVFNPTHFGKHREITLEGIVTVQKLWRGESLDFMAGAGKVANVKLFPQPMQKELPAWLTIVNNPETYQQAGKMGIGILTNLMGQTIQTLTENIAVYRQALIEHGHASLRGHVTVLLHTFVGEDLAEVRQTAKAPFCHYLQTTLSLLKNIALSQGITVDWENIDTHDRDYLLARVYQGYVENSALIGTPESCRPIVEQLLAIGVDEIACFLDFGIPTDAVMASLPFLNHLKDQYRKMTEQPRVTQPTAPKSLNMLTDTAIYFPLTVAQQQLYRLANEYDQHRGSLAYHIAVDLYLHGILNVSALQQAVLKVVEQHEALRTTIRPNGLQHCVHAQMDLSMSFLDFSALSREGAAVKVQNWLSEDTQQAFDLVNGPLWRLMVIKKAEQEHVLVLTIHHIISDGFSVGIFFETLLSEYQGICRGEIPASPAAMSFREFVATALEETQTKTYSNHTSFWLDKLKQIPPRILLPFDFSRPTSRIHRADRQSFSLNSDFCQKLRKIASQQKCTLFTLLAAIFSAFLARISGQDELLLVTPIAKRIIPNSEQVIGYCTNIMPLHFSIDCHHSFTAYLQQVKSTIATALAHPNYDFADIISTLAIDPSQFPLTNVLFNLDRFQLSEVDDLEITYVPRTTAYIDSDLFLNAIQHPQSLQFVFTYSTELFHAATIATLLQSFMIFLNSLEADPKQIIATIPLISGETADYLLNQCNATRCDFPQHRSLPELFYEQAQKTPNAIAINSIDRQLSYQQLDEQSNQLAHYLLTILPKPHATEASTPVLIGIAMPSSADFMIAVLAVMKIGFGYVPFEQTCPLERVKWQVADAKISLILSLHSQKNQLSQLDHTHIIFIDQLQLQIVKQPIEAPVCSVTGNTLAYVIYTSGSTGKPKGVMVEHQGIVRLIKNSNFMAIDYADNIAQSSNLAFDTSVLEIWSALLNGAKLTIVPTPILLDATELAAFMIKHHITILMLTPALFDHYVQVQPDMFNHLRYLVLGGDVVSSQSIKTLFASGGQPEHILNAYGPTENTVMTTIFAIDKPYSHRSIPIGKPLANNSVYVLDRFMQPVPMGVMGELYIGGAGVARGYLNNVELTAKQFVPNPFIDTADHLVPTSPMLYKTGDRVRWLPDGNLEFFGRMDSQVKINGFRVELSEIEHYLDQHPAISQSCVLVDEQQGVKRLVAFYSVKATAATTNTDVAKFLATKLPGYSLPNLYILLAELPKNSNGKIDKLRLRQSIALDTPSSNDCQYERQLTALWREILAYPQMDVNSHFYQSGGNSLFAAKLLSRINNHFQTRFNFSWLFAFPTIKQQALQLRQCSIPGTDHIAKLVVPLKKSGTNPPLFFIHPARAGAEAYVTCASLFPDEQPFYAIDAYPNLHDSSLTLESIASRYVAAILADKPQDIYFLGGWSLGGVFAYEVALQLSRIGKKVGGIYLIDSFLFTEEQRLQFQQLNAIAIGQPATRLALKENKNTRQTAELQLLLNYYPQSRWPKIYLMKATQKIGPTMDMTFAEKEAWLMYSKTLHSQPDNGWGQVCEQVVVTPVESDHYSMMNEDCLRPLVNQISDHIAASGALINL